MSVYSIIKLPPVKKVHSFLWFKHCDDGFVYKQAVEPCGSLSSLWCFFIAVLDWRHPFTAGIHWWASDAMLNFSKSVLIKKQNYIYLGLNVSKCSPNCKCFWFLIFFILNFLSCEFTYCICRLQETCFVLIRTLILLKSFAFSDLR